MTCTLVRMVALLMGQGPLTDLLLRQVPIVSSQAPIPFDKPRSEYEIGLRRVVEPTPGFEPGPFPYQEPSLLVWPEFGELVEAGGLSPMVRSGMALDGPIRVTVSHP